MMITENGHTKMEIITIRVKYGNEPQKKPKEPRTIGTMTNNTCREKRSACKRI